MAPVLDILKAGALGVARGLALSLVMACALAGAVIWLKLLRHLLGGPAPPAVALGIPAGAVAVGIALRLWTDRRDS
jgi:hypothetical protein